VRTVRVGELRNGLSKFLLLVRQGEEVLVRAHRLPVAKIVPVRLTEKTEEAELLLASAGLLKLGEGAIPSSFWSKPSVRISLQKLQRAAAVDDARTVPRSPAKLRRNRRG